MANELDFVTQILQASTPQPTGPVGAPTPDFKNQALLQMGLGLMQPIQPGQTPTGHAGAAISRALTSMQKGKAGLRGEQREQAKVDIAKGELEIARDRAASEKQWRLAQTQKIQRETKEQKGVDSKIWKQMLDTEVAATPIGESVDSWNVLRRYNEAAITGGTNVVQPSDFQKQQVFTSATMLQDARRIYGDAQVAKWRTDLEARRPAPAAPTTAAPAVPTELPGATKVQAVAINAAIPRIQALSSELQQMQTGAMFGTVIDQKRVKEIKAELTAMRSTFEGTKQGARWIDRIEQLTR